MRVLILNRFFWPDESATAMLATDVAEELVAAGHEVHAVCARGLYGGGEPLEARSEHNGVTVHRLWCRGMYGSSIPHRALAFATFHASLWLSARRLPRPEVVFVMSDPPLLLAAALRLRRLNGCRVLHMVADLYPDVAVAIGTIGSRSPVVRWLAGRSRSWLAGCDRVLALGPFMAEVLQRKGVESDRILLTPPWVDPRSLRISPVTDNPLRRELDVAPDDVLVIYSGNMGRCHPYETVVGAIRELAGHDRIHWLFVGCGVNRERLEGEVRRLGLGRVHFRPRQPRQRLGEALSAGDVHLISQDPRTVGLVVPSKLSAAMAVGRPVVFVGAQRSDVGDAIQRHGCGRIVAQGDVAGLASTIRGLAGDPELRGELGRRALEGFRAEFSSEIVLERIRRAVEGGEGQETAPHCGTASQWS